MPGEECVVLAVLLMGLRAAGPAREENEGGRLGNLENVKKTGSGLFCNQGRAQSPAWGNALDHQGSSVPRLADASGLLGLFLQVEIRSVQSPVWARSTDLCTWYS
jgi:hypothetical protein